MRKVGGRGVSALYISPRVPFSSEKPTARASLNEEEPSRRPIETVIPVPY